MLQVIMYDSHGFLKPYIVNQNPGETERQFDKRTYAEHLKLCHKWDGYKGTGNTVYMSPRYTPEQMAEYLKQWRINVED